MHVTRVINQTTSNQVLPRCFEFGLVEKNNRLVVLTTVKFVLERAESKTLGVALRIPRKRSLQKREKF